MKTKYACLLGSEPASVSTRPLESSPVRSSRPLVRQAQRRGRVTKLEAVRRALAHGASTPLDGISFIRREFDLDVSPTVFSTYKCRLRDMPLPDLVDSSPCIDGPTESPENAEPEKQSTLEMLDVAKTIKLLVERCGIDTIRGLVDLFASS